MAGELQAADLGRDTGGSSATESSSAGMQSFKQKGDGAIARSALDKMQENVSVMDFGAVGDGSTDDTAAIQRAIDFISKTYNRGTIFFPLPAVAYSVSTIQLRPNIWLFGPGKAAVCIRGQGTGPVIVTNSYPNGSTEIRQVGLRYLRIDNKNHECVQMYGSPDFDVQSCMLTTSQSPAFRARLSVRGKLTDNRITTSGPFPAVEGWDNCNGGDWGGNVVSGGRAGGGVDIGRTQNLSLRGNVYEVCGLYGVQIAKNDGNCSAIDASYQYFEQVAEPFKLGLGFSVFGVDTSFPFVGNNAVSMVPASAHKAVWQLGRVYGWTSVGGYARGSGKEAILEFYEVTNGKGILPLPEASEFRNLNAGNFGSNWSLGDGMNEARLPLIFGKNKFSFAGESEIGVERIYFSDRLSSGNAFELAQIISPTAGGGQVVAVEVIEQRGAISGRLSLGTRENAAENLSIELGGIETDLSRLSAIDRKKFRPLIKPNSGLYMQAKLQGDGSCRIKITYRT